ncbi:ubiquinol-cytochrome c reductase cytochrome c1 subunit [Thiogranum longum]|uniref:Ubiquinol-cytochrome c reductase cytochrome c1 subunit n=1 Tax=Thiogranum longum TaxID=1537524 RepID=A0A4R1HES0_9GAMM|nr:cytochrome c1 [Thiogranum longum]TCK17849.1 ubiquinol-cytochrome c reductase cytochrome c1 subunit [Thiogranum longum]
MKKQLFAILLLVSPALALASGGEVHLDKVHIDPTNKESLQRGARTFVNYCLSCHSAKYQRYNRLARDLGMSEDDVLENLMFTGDKTGDTMDIALSSKDAKKYFGAVPPDLTLVARVRGVDWLYTYLRTFYLDDSRPFGVNNLVFDKVGMPHVLWELQGWQKPVYETETDSEGHEHKKIVELELVEQGSQTPAEYDRTVRDLVNFLAYMAEPIKLERQALGIKVLLFLFVLFIITYLLKKEYWKDIH